VTLAAPKFFWTHHSKLERNTNTHAQTPELGHAWYTGVSGDIQQHQEKIDNMLGDTFAEYKHVIIPALVASNIMRCKNVCSHSAGGTRQSEKHETG